MKRIQRSRAKGWRMPEGAVYVGRPSRWGNPFVVGDTYMWLGPAAKMSYPIPTAREPGEYDHGLRVERIAGPHRAVALFRAWFMSGDARERYLRLRDIRGRDLVCWCPLDQPCHADVLLELANREVIG